MCNSIAHDSQTFRRVNEDRGIARRSCRARAIAIKKGALIEARRRVTQIGWQESSLRLRRRGLATRMAASDGLCIRQAANQNNITKQTRRNCEEACCNQEHAKAAHRVGIARGVFIGCMSFASLLRDVAVVSTLTALAKSPLCRIARKDAVLPAFAKATARQAGFEICRKI